MRVFAQIMTAELTLGILASIVCGDGYPKATLDQTTHETISGLRIDRYEGLDEEAIQAEYQWSLDMARLCLETPDGIRDRRRSWWTCVIEFQRHAGRTARYRGFAQQAIADYRVAIEYAHALVPLWVEPKSSSRKSLADVLGKVVHR